ncbi:Pyridoxal phosphate phosphatase YigL [Buchnera aphidicola (Protaphis terricola)]|uniref:Cof-type HAD-IIB family hydrolase n=1 Tax=Buchnera aphidicola TaxID=9 RepID=UPI003463E688
MYRIITVDLDGTLLSQEHKITKYTKKIIKLLINKGFYVVFASGRHHVDMIYLRNYLNIKIFMITSNGAKIYNLDNQLIFENNLDKDIALELLSLRYLDQDIITQVYQNDQWYINNNKIENNFCPNLSLLRYQFLNLNKFNFENISKIFFTSNNFKKLYKLKIHIINVLNNKVNINFSSPGCLEITSGNISKGYGLKLICKILGISLKECITIGNGMNDYDMLSISGKACIMENSDPCLKYALPYAEIIGNNINDGVAVFLNKKFLI